MIKWSEISPKNKKDKKHIKHKRKGRKKEKEDGHKDAMKFEPVAVPRDEDGFIESFSIDQTKEWVAFFKKYYHSKRYQLLIVFIRISQNVSYCKE